MSVEVVETRACGVAYCIVFNVMQDVAQLTRPLHIPKQRLRLAGMREALQRNVQARGTNTTVMSKVWRRLDVGQQFTLQETDNATNVLGVTVGDRCRICAVICSLDTWRWNVAPCLFNMQ